MRQLALAQEVEELDAFAQAPLHHLGTLDHLAHDRGDLAGAEIELFVEGLDRVEDLLVAQMRIMQRRDLNAVLVDQLRMFGIEPAILDRLLIEEGAGIRRGERDLDGMGIDLGRELYRLLDGFLGFAREAENEGAVDRHADLVAILGEALGHVDQHALLDVVQDLLIARLVPDEQQSQSVVLQDLQRLARHVRLRITRPHHAELAELLCDRFGTRQVVGKGVVVEEKLAHLREVVPGKLDLFDDVRDAAHAIAMAANGLRPEAEGATRLAAAARVDRDVGMLQIADEVVLDLQVALIDLGDERQLIHVLKGRALAIVDDVARGVAIAEAVDSVPRLAVGNFLDREIE